MTRRNIFRLTLLFIAVSLVAANPAEHNRAVQEQFVLHLLPWIVGGAIGFGLLGLTLFSIHNFGGTLYARHRRSLTFAENTYLFLLNLLLNLAFSGKSSGSGSSSSGGLSTGGGSFGGGGAGGSW